MRSTEDLSSRTSLGATFFHSVSSYFCGERLLDSVDCIYTLSIPPLIMTFILLHPFWVWLALTVLPKRSTALESTKYFRQRGLRAIFKMLPGAAVKGESSRGYNMPEHGDEAMTPLNYSRNELHEALKLSPQSLLIALCQLN